MNSLKLYSDGGCHPNPGPGAWAWALNEKTYESGTENRTTNNRMELMGIIKAIEWASRKVPGEVVEIYSDSKYCVNGFSSWMYSWKQNNWRKRDNSPVVNEDLWKILWANRNNAVLKWVKGHNGNVMNEFVDRLCVEAQGREYVDTRAIELQIAYLKGFRDGFGIDDNAADAEDFPEGCSDINQVFDRIEELEAALNPAKVLQKDCS